MREIIYTLFHLSPRFVSVLEESRCLHCYIKMSFRRIPFQFSSTDPVGRQAELEKRFGLPTRNNMYVDVANPLSMGATRNSETTSSPRLQHRVPIFLEGYDQPVKSSVDSVGSNSESTKKPNVRVIPIEVEGDYRPSARHRTFSGPSGLPKEDSLPVRDPSPLKRSMHNLSQPPKVNAATGPKVHNIPIKIEDRNVPVRNVTKPEKASKSPNSKTGSPKMNGCASSKQSSKGKAPEKVQEPPQSKVENSIEISLKKIEDVLKEFDCYASCMNTFTGTKKDKQYRYLDEMMTRCMLRLDDIDTMGNDNVRSARKGAVRKVQACINLLESKVNTENKVQNSGEPAENQSAEVDMKEEQSEVPKEKDASQDLAAEVGMAEQLNAEIEADFTSHAKVINEVELSESKLAGVENESIVNKEPEVEMAEEEEDSNTESADEIPEVEMAEGKEVEPTMPVFEVPTAASFSTCAKPESDRVQDVDMQENADTAKEPVDDKKEEASNSLVVEPNDVKIANTDSKELSDIQTANSEQNAFTTGDPENSSHSKKITEL